MQAPARRSTRKDRGENIRVTGALLRKAAKRGYVRRPQAARSIPPMILEASLCAAVPVRGLAGKMELRCLNSIIGWKIDYHNNL